MKLVSSDIKLKITRTPGVACSYTSPVEIRSQNLIIVLFYDLKTKKGHYTGLSIFVKYRYYRFIPCGILTNETSIIAIERYDDNIVPMEHRLLNRNIYNTHKIIINSTRNKLMTHNIGISLGKEIYNATKRTQ
jgi:hypothetical protein